MKKTLYFLTMAIFFIAMSKIAFAEISPCGEVKAGAEGVMCSITLRDATSGAGMVGLDETNIELSFYRQGTTGFTSMTEVALTGLDDAHTESGVLEISSTTQPGEYLVHYPDSAFAPGAEWVTVAAKSAGSFAFRRTFSLPDNSLSDIFSPDGYAQSGTATSLTLASNASSSDDIYNDNMLSIVEGTGAGQSRCIADYNGTSKVATVESDWIINPNSTSGFKISPGCGGGGGVSGTVDANVVSVDSNAVTSADDFKADTAGLSTFDNTIDNVNVSSLPDSAITSAAGNKIADYVLRRNSATAEASADGDSLTFQSLIGAVSKQTNKIAVDGGSLKTYRSDNATVLGTQSVTTDSSAAPITGLN